LNAVDPTDLGAFAGILAWAGRSADATKMAVRADPQDLAPLGLSDHADAFSFTRVASELEQAVVVVKNPRALIPGRLSRKSGANTDQEKCNDVFLHVLKPRIAGWARH